MRMHRSSRREFLKALGLSAVSMAAVGRAGVAQAAGGTATRPNVILVMTDDQGYGDLGCHGNTIIDTPNLDALYEESVRFTDFHVCPTCAPTRASLMTGHYCNSTGVWHTVMGRSLLRRDEITMADAFAASGYRTGIFGKWHLGDNFPFRPQDRGFQEVLIHGGGGVGQTPDFFGNDYQDDTYFHNGEPKPFNGYCTDVWFDGALNFIEASKGRPFFCYIPTNAPHGPFNVPEEYSDAYKDTEAPNANFYGMITNIDENMGRLEAKLRELGLAENTVLIFITDNGTAAGFAKGKGHNVGMRGTKGSEYDGGHRVPCFFRWPVGGIEGGSDITRLTAHVDMLPTLIDLCGLTKPEDLSFHGDSLAPLLRSEGREWPARTLVTDSQRIDHPEKWRKSSVMTDRWRLINGKELYDMSADPGQKKDVAGAHSEVVAELRAAYDAWWAETSTRFDEYCEIVLGSDKENPARLTSHDWHCEGLPPWSQTYILQGRPLNGFWAVDVEQDGLYEFELRRWPVEVDAPITASIPGGTAVKATDARLKIADVDMTQPIPEGARAVTFSVELKAGKTQLQTWLMDGGDASRGAYYAYVKRV